MARPLSILLVEDSESDAKLITMQLVDWGFDVDCERVWDADGMEGAIARRAWDIVISDWRLPRFSGLDALAIVKSSGRGLPFVIVSGVAPESVALAAMRHGAQDYISKDHLARLGAAVDREVVQARQRNEREAQRQRDERFFDLTPDLLCVMTFEGRFERANEAWRSGLGWTPAEVQAKRHEDLLHPDDRALAIERHAALTQGVGGIGVSPTSPG